MSGKKSASYKSENQSTLVAGKKRIRNRSVCVWLWLDVQAKIRERMADVGVYDFSDYMREMEITSYVLHVDFAPVKKITRQRRQTNGHKKMTADPLV